MPDTLRKQRRFPESVPEIGDPAATHCLPVEMLIRQSSGGNREQGRQPARLKHDGERVEFPAHREVHATIGLHADMVFTAWMVLFVVQTALIAAHRTVLHRRLGVAGAVLALAIIVLGVTVAIAAASRPPAPDAPPGFPPPLVFLVIPLGDIVAFGVLVSVGLYNRRNRDVHKRLMLLATIAILNAALGRLVFPGGMLAVLGLPPNPMTLIGLTALYVAACLSYDRATLGRIHPAFLWGGMFIIASDILRLVVGSTPAWLAFAKWLTR